MRKITRFLVRDKRGAAAVEFAFVAPIFLCLVLGAVEIGRALWIKATMQFAVEQTTRHAVINTTATTGELEIYAANELASAGFNNGDVVFTATQDNTGGRDFVTVSASWDFSTVAGLINLPDLTLLATSRVPLE